MTGTTRSSQTGPRGFREASPHPSFEAELLLGQLVEVAPDRRDGELAALCTRYPLHAELIRRGYAEMLRLGLLEDPEGPCEIPARLGDFQLRRRLGGGGMGVVYEAVQGSLGREVALKIIRPQDIGSARARDRFQREVGTVARLQHRGIVPILAVGEHEGIPYFAMERVPGCTLAEVLDELRGSVPASLSGRDLQRIVARLSPGDVAEAPSALFESSWAETCAHLVAEVADALQHAHQRGVLHRDVKPSNVMITARGRIVLLDFGLARAEGAQRLTRTGGVVGSLAYMSPEQIRGQDLDARTDVYSLGVTLYELLALRPPYGHGHRAELRQAILHADPDPVRQANLNVSRDLETVTQAAMDPDRGHRYPEAAAFARDLRLASTGGPVLAHRPGPKRRLARWVRRHPTVVVAALMGVLLLTGAFRLVRRQIRDADELQEVIADARLEAHRSRSLVRLLPEVFTGIGPALTREGKVQPALLLDHWRRTLQDRCPDRVSRSFLSGRLADLFRSLGIYDQASTLYRDVVVLERERLPGNHGGLAGALEQLARFSIQRGDLKSARSAAIEALDMRQRLHGPDHVMVGLGLQILATVEQRQGSFATARTLHERSLAILQRALPPGHRRLVQTLSAVATFLDEEGSHADAEVLARRGIELATKHGDSPLALSRLQAGLCTILQNQGRFEEAGRLLAAAEAAQRALLPLGHPDELVLRSARARLLAAQGRIASAAEVLRKVVARKRDVFGTESQEVAADLGNLGHLLQNLGRFPEAETSLREALGIARGLHGLEHPIPAAAALNLGGLLTQMARDEEAEALNRAAIAGFESTYGEAHPTVARAKANLATLLAERGEEPQADALFAQAYRALRDSLGELHHDTLNLLSQQATRAMSREDRPTATRLFEQALVGFRRQYPMGRPEMCPVLLGLARYRLEDRDDLAGVPLLQEALALLKRYRPPCGLETIECHFLLGQALARLEELDTAEIHLVEAYELCKRRSVKPDPGTHDVLRILVRFYLRNDRRAEAARYRALLAKQPR